MNNNIDSAITYGYLWGRWETNMHDELIMGFKTYLREQENVIAESTIENYAAIAELYITHLDLSGVSLDRASKEDVLAFRNLRLKGEGKLAKATRNIRLFALKALYNYLISIGISHFNPTLEIKRIRLPKQRSYIPLTIRELLRLTDTMEEGPKFYRSRNVAMADTLFFTGMRLSEMLRIGVPDIDFENKMFHNTFRKGDKKLPVYFNDVVAGDLKRYLADREKMSIKVDVQALFVSDRREPMNKRSAQQMFRHYGKKAGILKPVTPHVFRHTTATVMLESGVDIRVVQEILGHDSISTTQVYAQVNDRLVDEALEILSKQYKKEKRRHQKKTEEKC